MIKTVGDIRKAIDGLPDEMEIELFVHCKPEWKDEYPLHGWIATAVEEYSCGNYLEVHVHHFCPDAYVNQKREEDND